MTATDELRLMLDERGIILGACEQDITPEQAIAATLGVGTCHADETDTIKCWVKCKDEPSTEHMELIHVMECSACGGTYEYVNGGYEFCPRCGRRHAPPPARPGRPSYSA